MTSGTDSAGDERSVRQLEADYDAAWNAGDSAALVAAFSEDAVVVNPFGAVAAGRAEIARVLSAFLGGAARGTRHTSEVTRVVFLTPEVALVDGRALLEWPGRTAAARPAIAHHFTDVLVKQNGTWRISQVRGYVFMEGAEPTGTSVVP